jgi:hypothetical protein
MERYKRFGRSEIIRFLHTLDDFLEEALTVCVIGGSAAVLGYHANIKTADMDVFEITNAQVADLKQAARRAFDVTGIDLTIDRASIADLPYNYEERLRRARDVRFRKLTIKVPDKYDLVLSKTIRCHPHDIEAIVSIHEHHPLSEKTLTSRFEKEIWSVAVTNSRNFAFNMVLVMSALFGKTRAEPYKTRWGLTGSA